MGNGLLPRLASAGGQQSVLLVLIIIVLASMLSANLCKALQDARASGTNDKQTNSSRPCAPKRGRPSTSASSTSARVKAQEPASTDTKAAGSASATTKTVETAVFIDQALESKFQGLSGGLVDLHKLVMTTMKQVQALFSYSSLKTPVKIKLVLIQNLRDGEKNGNTSPNSEGGNIDAYLRNFCNWQVKQLDREKRLWWDHAVLLSGLDLYKTVQGNKNHTGVLGLAWVGGMCNGNYSCTISEASDLESAFVIAHEIGHSLGIQHDGLKNDCDPNRYIMSDKTGPGKVHWSSCSNQYLADSIARGQLTCLDSEKSGDTDSLYDLSKLRDPGQVYSLDDQCKLAFGSNHSAFISSQPPFNSVCRKLWCVAKTWAKPAHPALEGSNCGEASKFCREGKCV